MNPSTQPLPIVVLISGSGSNLQSIIDAQHGGLPIRIEAVISNEPDAYGLQRARQAGIPTQVLNHRHYPDRAHFDADLQRIIDNYHPGLVVLAGFMRILTAELVQHYHGRMLNIHPSLLPKLQGLHTHRRALEENHTEHGASVHFVTEELDGGPVVMQARVPVLPDDDPETLARRVLKKEHLIYPHVIGLFAQGRLRLEQGQPMLDGQPLGAPLQWDQPI